MAHSIEFLKKAREVGATHTTLFGAMFKVVSMHVERFNGIRWVLSSHSASEITSSDSILEIDFSPLDDINTTRGAQHDTRTDKNS